MSSEERDVKPNIDEDEAGPSRLDPVTPVKQKDDKITITVQNPSGVGIQTFKMKRTATFAKMFAAAADRFGLDMNLIRFTLNGQRVRPEQTPNDHPELDEVGADETPVIDIQVQQVGGGY